MKRKVMLWALAGSALSVSALASAETTVSAGEPHYAVAGAQWQGAASSADQRLAIFTPTADPVRTTIDYE
ncbi:MAG TPA: hypothetical protein VI407_08880, partial [Erythrobacter sp.]